MKKLLLLLLSVIYFAEKGNAQTNYGTTGLMNMPTADMQRDKTFMLGGNWLIVMLQFLDGGMILGTIILTSLFFLGWRSAICVWGTRRFLSTMVVDQIIGFRQLTASLSIKTVPSISGCGYGKRGGGKHGHHRF